MRPGRSAAPVVRACVHACMHACIHAYTHTHTRTHTNCYTTTPQEEDSNRKPEWLRRKRTSRPPGYVGESRCYSSCDTLSGAAAHAVHERIWSRIECGSRAANISHWSCHHRPHLTVGRGAGRGEESPLCMQPTTGNSSREAKALTASPEAPNPALPHHVSPPPLHSADT